MLTDSRDSTEWPDARDSRRWPAMLTDSKDFTDSRERWPAMLTDSKERCKVK